MTCIKAQSMITPFINNKLSLKEMEEFLEHVGSCPNCMEELEFYYALLTAMKQLDEDKNLSEDFRLELSGKMNRAQDKILHAKYTYYRKYTILILIMILVAFLMGISYSEESNKNTNNVIKSDFRIRNAYHEERFFYIERQLEEYSNQQQIEEIPIPSVKLITE